MNIHSAAWQRFRLFILARDPFCPGYPAGYHRSTPVRTNSVDHKQPRSSGGPTTLDNCRGLCSSCNSRKAMAEEGARTWR